MHITFKPQAQTLNTTKIKAFVQVANKATQRLREINDAVKQRELFTEGLNSERVTGRHLIRFVDYTTDVTNVQNDFDRMLQDAFDKHEIEFCAKLNQDYAEVYENLPGSFMDNLFDIVQISYKQPEELESLEINAQEANDLQEAFLVLSECVSLMLPYPAQIPNTNKSLEALCRLASQRFKKLAQKRVAISQAA